MFPLIALFSFARPLLFNAAAGRQALDAEGGDFLSSSLKPECLPVLRPIVVTRTPAVIFVAI